MNVSTLLGPTDSVEKRNISLLDILDLQTAELRVYLSCFNGKSVPSRESSLWVMAFGGCSSL